MINAIDKRLYTREQSDKLFNEYSMLVNKTDVVSFYYAKMLFTDKHFDKLEGGTDYNCCGTEFANHYLYTEGFRKLVTYHNLDIINSLVAQ